MANTPAETLSMPSGLSERREPGRPRLVPTLLIGIIIAGVLGFGAALLLLIVQYDILHLVDNAALMDDLIQHLPADMAAAVAQGSAHIASQTRWVMLVVLLVSGILALLFVLMIAFMQYAVVRPILRVTEALQQLDKAPGTLHIRRERLQELDDIAIAVGAFDQALQQINERTAQLEREIAERQQAQAKLLELATTDGLTGLHNRRYFMETASQEFERARRYRLPLSLLMIDADRFKAINDRFGHHVGDDVLKVFAAIGRRQLRDVDLFARMGGEEFAVLLPQTDCVEARVAAERLRLAIADYLIDTDQGPLSFTVSIGLACLESSAMDLDDLLRLADTALYQAKQKGRNRVEPALCRTP